jgi:hypothetical protein
MGPCSWMQSDFIGIPGRWKDFGDRKVNDDELPSVVKNEICGSDVLVGPGVGVGSSWLCKFR